LLIIAQRFFYLPGIIIYFIEALYWVSCLAFVRGDDPYVFLESVKMEATQRLSIVIVKKNTEIAFVVSVDHQRYIDNFMKYRSHNIKSIYRIL